MVPSIYGLAPYYAHLGSDVPGVFDAASMGLGIAKALAHAFDLDRGAYNEWGELVRNAWRLHNEWGDRVPTEKSWLKHFIAEIHVCGSSILFQLRSPTEWSALLSIR